MLGAYQPHSDVISQLSQAIISIVNAFPPNRYVYDSTATSILEKWVADNGQNYADMFISDYNRKNPPRGPAPRVLINIGHNPPKDTVLGEYSTQSKMITLYVKNMPRLMFLPIEYMVAKGSVNNDQGDSFKKLSVAVQLMSTLMHETLHHIQLHNLDDNAIDRIMPEGLLRRDIYERVFYPYLLSKEEVAAFGVSISMFLSATIPPKYYSSVNGPSVRSMTNYIEKKKLIPMYITSTLLGYLADRSGTKLAKDIDFYMIDVEDKLISAREELIIAMISGQSLSSELITKMIKDPDKNAIFIDLMRNYKLFIKNLYRYLRHFEPINRALSPYIPNL